MNESFVFQPTRAFLRIIYLTDVFIDFHWGKQAYHIIVAALDKIADRPVSQNFNL